MNDGRADQIASRSSSNAGYDAEHGSGLDTKLVVSVAEVFEPYTKQSDAKLRELRFGLGRQAIRIANWIPPGRRIILLIAFAETKDWDPVQVARVKKAMLACMQAEHNVEEE